MPNNETKRTLTILQYLRENTDDSHPATIAQILSHLTDHGIATTRQTVSKDFASLTKMGIDIVCEELPPEGAWYKPWAYGRWRGVNDPAS